ncbi:hypothetical protein AAP_04040 [Ascosphaera apis ARSEF 7405]|uniref:Uncharacterized protein n=1 Tax=Ascosphaera apis ARSEF 7405 TaxID=392613 RepID=A0A166NHQ5_9EURO|nr:hypothetical protein AAP_04040 [Ascosphaera apis ARSEF 7405]
MSRIQGQNSPMDSDRRHVSATRWQPLSSEDIGAPIDQEIMIPETPPNQEPHTTDEEEDEEFCCVGRRQAEYHHRPPVWRVEVLDGTSVGTCEEDGSSPAQDIRLTPSEHRSRANSHECGSGTASPSRGAPTSRISVPGFQPKSEILTAIGVNCHQFPAMTAATTGGMNASLQNHERALTYPSGAIRTVSHLHNVWSCASTHKFAQLTPGTRVIYVGNVEFPEKEKHRFGELWVVYRLVDDVWVNCIRVEHDLDKTQEFESKIFTIKPLDYPVRLFRANIPLSAVTQERHFANYFSYMWQMQGAMESMIAGERPPISSNQQPSLTCPLIAKDMSRKMLLALFMDMTFRNDGPAIIPVRRPSRPQVSQELGTTHKLESQTSRAAIDATTYLLDTPDCRLCDPIEAGNGEEKMKRRLLKDTLRRHKSNKHVREKVKSLFGS